jgi:hypothetical protein
MFQAHKLGAFNTLLIFFFIKIKSNYTSILKTKVHTTTLNLCAHSNEVLKTWLTTYN